MGVWRVLTGLLALLLTLAAAPSAVAAPTCAEGPQVEGDTIVGTPCDDTVHAPRSITAVLGEGGNDTLFGGRGNDRLFGGEGNDRLYGGIGDDRPRGGPGDDLLSGGFGADSLDGEEGGDFLRGDATIDAIFESGISGIDTLSYATGATPGFTNTGTLFAYTGFPATAEGRGVYADLLDDDETEDLPKDGFANNGLAPSGGGVDLELEGSEFEVVIGTAFPDFLVGSPGAETIYGGGGADVILGEGGADQLHGGAEGDSCSGAGATVDCETSSKAVSPRSAGLIAVGTMAPGAGPPALYLTGSTGADRVAATYSETPSSVAFQLLPGSVGTFDPVATAAGGCGAPAAGKVVCSLASAPDSVLLSGLDGPDAFTASGFPETTSLVLLGNEGADSLTTGSGEDVLIDGAGNDVVDAGGADDALPNNPGTDALDAGSGEDLFISNEVCAGDLLDGGPDRDNANWANFNAAVALDLASGSAGLASDPDCSGGSPTTLPGLEDLEGSSLGDSLLGDGGPNQLLGRLGADTYFAAAGNDNILANSGTPVDDPDPTIDCGEGDDLAQIDFPENGPDAAPVACEEVEERAPNSFRPPDTPTDPEPAEPPGESPPSQLTPTPPQPPRVPRPPRDSDPPETRVLRRPGRILPSLGRPRRVSFAFAADEPGASFRCRLDDRRTTACRSPRAYFVRRGRHRFRVFAIDAAGNPDRTPAVVVFRVRRR